MGSSLEDFRIDQSLRTLAGSQGWVYFFFSSDNKETMNVRRLTVNMPKAIIK
ncbi:hypothetical protein NRS6085_01230 [Bacillus subtilis]|nr:hypothetical protein NRS6085_04391 [Bacillus subtilis]CAI6222431.1 hypothetical protein NRS6085_01230 [Bacillus subtilis]